MKRAKPSEQQAIEEKLSKIEEQLDKLIRLSEHYSRGLDRLTTIVAHQTDTLENIVRSMDAELRFLEDSVKQRKELTSAQEATDD